MTSPRPVCQHKQIISTFGGYILRVARGWFSKLLGLADDVQDNECYMEDGMESGCGIIVSSGRCLKEEELCIYVV